jgi:hypothetical protein
MAISGDIAKKLKESRDGAQFFADQIVIIDAEKEIYDNAISIVDQSLSNQIGEVNKTLVDVQSAYQDRINVGCRTDLVWRVVGIDTSAFPTEYDIEVTKISLGGYAGAGATGIGSTLAFSVVGTSGSYTTYPLDTTLGFQDDNLHGIKYYNEPITKDIGDTTVASFIGTIGIGETILTMMIPADTDIQSDFSAGQLITCEKNGVFASTNNTIVGIGTTIADISKVVTGIGTTQTLVPTIILGTTTIGIASAPESNGKFVTFTVLDNPVGIDTYNQYAIDFTSNPFSPQTIGIVGRNGLGIGRSIYYDNSGIASNTQSWKPENAITGVPDIDDVVEPPVGAGKIWYTVGFSSTPSYLGTPQPEGTTLTVTSFVGLYDNLSSCPTQETNLTNAINIRDTKESEFNSGLSTFSQNLLLSTALRDERNTYEERIWGIRQSIGGEIDEINRYNSLKINVKNSSLID